MQCKLHKEGEPLTPGQIAAEVAKVETFRPLLKAYVVATTSPRDSRLQTYMNELSEARARAGQFRVYVHFWEDLTSRFAVYPDIRHQHYAQFFAPAESPPRADDDPGPTANALLHGPIRDLQLETVLQRADSSLPEQGDEAAAVYAEIADRLAAAGYEAHAALMREQQVSALAGAQAWAAAFACLAQLIEHDIEQGEPLAIEHYRRLADSLRPHLDPTDIARLGVYEAYTAWNVGGATAYASSASTLRPCSSRGIRLRSKPSCG